jgi:hypothetical protein
MLSRLVRCAAASAAFLVIPAHAERSPHGVFLTDNAPSE